MVACWPPVKVVDATGEVIFKSTNRINLIFLNKLGTTHEDVGKRGGCEGERNDGFAEHVFSTMGKERYL